MENEKFKPVGINSLFVREADGWDMDFDIQLYNAVLNVDIGQFKIGQKVDVFSLLIMECDDLTVQIDHEGETFNFPIKFSFSIGQPERGCRGNVD